MNRFKLVFFSPSKDTQRILKELFTRLPSELGKIGDYEQCAFISNGTGFIVPLSNLYEYLRQLGQFKPLSGANPMVGSVGTLERVNEDRVEILVTDQGKNEQIKQAVQALKAVHPYEEVAYDVYRIEDF